MQETQYYTIMVHLCCYCHKH